MSFLVWALCLLLCIVALARSEVDFATFERTQLPFDLSVELPPSVTTKVTSVKFNADDLVDKADIVCELNQYSSEECEDLMARIRSILFNPPGVIFDRQDQQHKEYNPMAMKAVSSNNNFECILPPEGAGAPANETMPSCLLHAPAESALDGRGFYERDLLRMRRAFTFFSAQALLSMCNVAFIHSCLPSGVDSPYVLDELLRKLESSGTHAVLGAIWVFHYGSALPEDFLRKYTENSALSSILHIEYVSTDIARFEVPTLQRVIYFAKLVQYLRTSADTDNDDADDATTGTQATNVLYLHTKGASYREERQQIAQWRDYMTYFLLNQHHVCLNLLGAETVEKSIYFHQLLPMEKGAKRADNSQEIIDDAPPQENKEQVEGWRLDAVGVDLKWNTEADLTYQDGVRFQFYSGNFWWARSTLLSRLPRLSVQRNNKLDAEMWLGSGGLGRLGSLFNSGLYLYDEYLTPDIYVQRDNCTIGECAATTSNDANNPNDGQGDK